MSRIFHRKIRYRAGAALLVFVMLGLIFAAFREEGSGGWYVFAALAAALVIPLGYLMMPPLRNAKGAGKVLRGVLHILLILITPFLAMGLLQNFTLDPLRIYPLMMAANAVFYYLIYLVLTFLTGSFAAGYLIGNWIFLIIGVANYFVVQFRGSPIVPWDLFSIGTAASVANNYSYEITWRFVFSAFGFFALIVCCTKLTEKLQIAALRLLLAAAGIAGLVFSTYQLQQDSVKDLLGMDVTLFTPNVRYRNNGFLAAFLGNLHLINVQEPSGYTVSKAVQIGEETQQEHAGSASENTLERAAEKLQAGQMPNLIVIMDEAFSDLQVLGEFETDIDYMPNFRRLMAEYSSGHLMVSVKGGNTANTEYEFLSGDSMAFLPAGSVVYQQFIRDNIPVLPSYLASLGYSTLAIHPYLASGWDRDTVYPLLGFQDFLSQADFSDPRKMRLYISDESAFDKIIEEYEKKKEDPDPQFIFEVTMQNHSGYSKEYPGFAEEVHLTGLTYENVQTRAAEKYLTLVYETDQALGKLMAYFETVQEPTIIVMFGDHQPSDYVTDVIDRLVGYDPEVSLEEAQKSYLVPYFVWNNFGMEMEDHKLVSVNYLGADILQAAGIPLTTYHEFLLVLQEQLPVISGGAYLDPSGTYHSYDETDEAAEPLLNRYNTLQYNHLNDIRNRVTELFSKPAGDAQLSG